jgi:hypothetical protein
MSKRIAVAGGGVAGLSAVLHLLEIEQQVAAEPGTPDPLEIVYVAPLVPHAGSEGSGLGGKAMSRSFVGRYDTAHGGMDRHPFYGPAMPERGTVPHGYHVLWGYPNVRRMLMRAGEGPDISGMLRPPGGSPLIASFQALLDDPTPGGPGIGLMGLCDPEHPETATREVSKALFRLRETALFRPAMRLFELLFGALTDQATPLVFADLLFAKEIDLEMRITLIAAAIEARTLNPETATMPVNGVETPLWKVEYDVWAEHLMVSHSTALLTKLSATPDVTTAVFANPAAPLVDGFLDLLKNAATGASAIAALLGVLADAGDQPPMPSDGMLGDWGTVSSAVHDLLADLPGALHNLATRQYPVWRTLHFRFAPDATFASPYSFDAAQAVRSLAFCFQDAASSRMWSADGARIQSLWLRLWENIQDLASRTPHVTLVVREGRIASVQAEPDGRVRLQAGETIGHGPRTAGHDLGYPHQPDLRPPIAPQNVVDIGVFDVFIPCMPPALLADLLRAAPYAAARAQLAPLESLATVSTELLIWTRDAIQYAPAAAEGLRSAAITGLEGPFCLLADYRCGLWSQAALDREDPFGDGQFTGSILESCGGYHDLYAAADRADAYGWPAEAKQAIADLLDKPAQFQSADGRLWPHETSPHWHAQVRDGTWSDARLADPAAIEDWFVASRWLAWGFLQQLSQCQALGPRAVRQFAYYADLLDPRNVPRSELIAPSATLLSEVRFVVMRNANRRNRFFNPGVGDWIRRPVSGLPLDSAARIFPAGDWTRNGLDVICMEGACLSAMRAAKASWKVAQQRALPTGVPETIQVLPNASWYAGDDPMERG